MALLEETKRTPTKASAVSHFHSTPNSAKKDRSAGRSAGAAGANIDMDEAVDAPDASLVEVAGFYDQSDRMVNLIVKKLLID
eukprot:CAMPEP_0185590594 /NCGR_PEP_ID=MMETSP0434-20130131/61319_1 /TAXON_ID=626734 ORGANISM="Favella taraikaensis, Strain Fe Narragansett Bay" /NCGR_SAMPLE_ID=MMETSP0434 /ASSEMBLY_ACC=CAM_ASM_000379 /LENGTH=81 /DNA_ID=CAMNT_0028214903 /DNA_START=774 /DNA_END=1019 /DNA_ORIENTATION=-